MGSPPPRIRTETDTSFLLDVERALKSMSIFDDPLDSGELRILFDRLRRADGASLPLIDAEPRKGLTDE